MAVHIDGVFEKSLNEKITESKILVVGAGGIGCELLKNLVMTGFEKLHVIDLDTIELSNLNRQFLFHKQHIGRPKAIVAKESVLKFNPKANISAFHDSITSTAYDVEFYRQFTAVANALDNIGARAHVNRMCLAAEIPLIESGSSGYLGQVTVYQKKFSECFECIQRKAGKSYPNCTIRNTPSEPAHCVVWAKHLFNQLFGETDGDPDKDVSPDLADPKLEGSVPADGNVARVNTREWAKSCNYDSVMIFNKLFTEDVEYLHQMENLWKDRERPQALDFTKLPDAVAGSSKQSEANIEDQIVWSIQQCADTFCNSIDILKTQLVDLNDNGVLVFDKDDDVAMDFVTAVSNLRSHCFHIPLKSRFDIKAIAGNIIPAIATTNAAVSGLMVLQIINVLKGDFTKCRSAWLNESARTTKKLIGSSELAKANPHCMSCCPQTAEFRLSVNVDTFSMRSLEEKILKQRLHFQYPDATTLGNNGKVLISSDEDDLAFQAPMRDRPLAYFGVGAGTRILCDDFFQRLKVVIMIISRLLADQEFEMEDLNQYELEKQKESKETQTAKQTQVSAQTDAAEGDDSDVEEISDEVQIVGVIKKSNAEDSSVEEASPAAKRSIAEDGDQDLPPAKKARTSLE